MNPFFFGSSKRPLFGIYHPPQSQPARNRGVVLCNPHGEEAIKTHRAYGQLAGLLARERFHVLRFDYFGTGDSAGDCDDGTTEQWLEDVGVAATELKDMAGVQKVSFVGLRYGATLAFQAARGRRDVDKVVMWDPIVDGGAYIQELRDLNETFLRSQFDSSSIDAERLSPPTGEAALGFPLGPKLRAELRETDLMATTSGRVRRVTVMTSAESEACFRLCTHLAEQSVDVQHEHVPIGPLWNVEDSLLSAWIVPKQAHESIARALS